MHIKHLVITDYKGVMDTKIMESIVAKAMEPYGGHDREVCSECKLLHCTLSCSRCDKWDYYSICDGYADFKDWQPAMPVASLESNCYWSVVMPNGAWVEQGDRPLDEWRRDLRNILTTYGYCRAILVDYHC